MMTRVNKLLIGKDIDRTAGCVDEANLVTIAANIADGEILVLDKDKKILAAGATVADTDVIYICQGLPSTYNYSAPDGSGGFTAVTGVRKVKISDPIEAGKVRLFSGKSYAAKVEQSTVFTNAAVSVPVGTEYILRIVYKDMFEHPGQFTQTYRFTATALDDEDAVFAGLAAAVNGHKGARVTATANAGADTLTIAGKAIPERTSSLNNIDEFDQVRFDVALNVVDSDGNWAAAPLSAATSTTEASAGVGTWEQVRDMEKFSNAYMGVTDTTTFPIAKPEWSTSTSETYDLIVIEHDKSYLSPDNQYVKQAPMTTIIAIDTGANGQTADVLARLNPWMASTPGAFANIAV
jgi:hypothetical protein